MSKKKVLSEVRRFMKLANLDANLSSNFVNKLSETDLKSSLYEEEEEEIEMDMDVEEEPVMGDEEIEMDDEIEVDMDVEVEDEAVLTDEEADILISLGQKLAAAQEIDAEDEVEDAMDDLEDADELEDEAADLEDDAADDLADAADDIATLEEILGDVLGEDEDYTAKKEKAGADKRKGAEKRGAEGTLAKTKGHGRVDYVNETSQEEEREDEEHDFKRADRLRDEEEAIRRAGEYRRRKKDAKMDETLVQEVLKRVRRRLATMSKE